MPWNRMNYEHSLPPGCTRLTAFTLFSAMALLLQACICMWKDCVWSGQSLFGCKSHHPDGFISEPEALLLLVTSILPGLPRDPHLPPCLKGPWRTELAAQLRLWNHITCSVLIPSTSKAFGLDGILDKKIPIERNRNVTKYRSYVLNVSQLNSVTSLFSTAKHVSSSCTWLLCIRLQESIFAPGSYYLTSWSHPVEVRGSTVKRRDLRWVPRRSTEETEYINAELSLLLAAAVGKYFI